MNVSEVSGAPSAGASACDPTKSGVRGRDPLTPRLEEGRWVLEWGQTRVAIDANRGGRITSLRCGELEVLSGAEVHESNFGSTFWTSPQEDWGWPPVAAIDSDAYTAEVDGEGLTLTSRAADIGGKPVRVTKRFKADAVSDALCIEYVLENLGDSPLSLAAWEITRVPCAGLTFFPTGEFELSPVAPHAELPRERRDGVTWVDHGAFAPGGGAKLNADGKEGWLAHVQRGVLFLKTFEDVTPEQQARGEGEVEIFVDEHASYVEVENQGPYAAIPAGGSHTYTVRWQVTALPTGLVGAVGSAALVDWVRSSLLRSSLLRSPPL